MLVEIAIADAYGAGFEFSRPSEGRENDVSRYVANPRYPHHVPGTYTDDAQMSLAVAECLAEGGRTRRDFAAAFLRAFKRDPRDEYARGFQAFLESVVDVDDFLARIRPGSDRNGAAMRSVPIGLLPDIWEVIEVAAEQARLTHDTPTGVASAQGVALMAHHQAFGIGPLRQLPLFLREYVPGIDWLAPNRDRVMTSAEETVRAALTNLCEARGLSALLRAVVDQGGDTDTVAAIAVGVGSLSAEIENDLPDGLATGLEDGPWGRGCLAAAEARLRSAPGFRAEPG